MKQLLACVLIWGLPARAQATEFALEADDQAVVTAGLLGVTLLLTVPVSEWDRLSPCDSQARPPTPEEITAFDALPVDGGTCDPSRVFLLDRPFVGGRSETMARLSDGLLLGGLLAPYGYAVGRELPEGTSRAEGAGADALVSLQVQATTILATRMLKLIVRRPRPYTFDPRVDKMERFHGDSRLSFPSGHTSAAFASASVLSLMVLERTDDAGVKAGVVAGAYVFAALVGALRVASGRHFLTDVLAGAALGSAVGWLLPQAYLEDEQGATMAFGRQQF